MLFRSWIGHAPVQPRLLELPATGGVFLAHLLDGGAADDHAIARGVPGREPLQVKAAQELVTVADSPRTCLVAKVPNQVNLASHGRQDRGVLVLDAQLECFDAFGGVHALTIAQVCGRGNEKLSKVASGGDALAMDNVRRIGLLCSPRSTSPA